MEQRIVHGAKIDVLTPDEFVNIIGRRGREVTRVRAPESVQLDANGNGQVDVYKVPNFMEFGARRVTLQLGGDDPFTNSIPLNGDGSQVVKTVANPGAGNQWTATVPAGKRWKVISAVATLTTSAVVANRIPGIVLTVGGVPVFANQWGGAGVTASLVRTILSQQGTTLGSSAGPFNSTVIPITLDYTGWLNAGDTIASTTVAMDAGDTYTNISLVVLEISVASIAYLRSGTLIEYGVPTGPNETAAIPGVQTWGSEQGPYLQNAEVFQIRATGLTPNGVLLVTLEGLLSGKPTTGPNGA